MCKHLIAYHIHTYVYANNYFLLDALSANIAIQIHSCIRCSFILIIHLQKPSAQSNSNHFISKATYYRVHTFLGKKL